MPLQPDAFPALEDALNRLATESILAQAGKEEGMVPVLGLLADLRVLLAPEATACEAVASVRAQVEKALEDHRPFSEGLLEALRALSTWLLVAMADLKAGRAPIPFAAAPAEPAAPPPAAPVAAALAAVGDDVRLPLNLAENGDLLVEFYTEAVEHLLLIESGLLTLEQHPADPEALNSVFRSFHTIKGNAGFLGLIPVHTLAHEVETLLDLARTGRIAITSAIVTEILRSRDALQALNLQVARALDTGELPAQVIPVGHLIRAVRALSVEPKAVSPSSAAGSAAPAMAPVPEAPAVPAAAGALSGATVRVSTEKLDSLMDVVGELVIVQSQLLETARLQGEGHTPLHRDVAQLNRIAKDLQRTAMSLRMIPLRQTFQKMERLARDLGRDLGKKVIF
jgi:two-component system, chemotaxis family, sensor kinase CheA